MQKRKTNATAVAMRRGKMLYTLPWKSRQEPVCSAPEAQSNP